MQITLASTRSDQGAQTVATAGSGWTLLNNINATAGGICWFRNISTNTTTTQYISLAAGGATSAATSFPFAQLAPGEFVIMRNAATSFSAQAVNTNAQTVQYGVLSP